MIELRWLEKEETITRLGCTLVEKVRVLQFRTECFDEDECMWWSDWQDVPTVREDDPAV